MAANKLIGENYITPDLVAKVTGQAKYAEDFRADGMLFCKLLLSPVSARRASSSIDTQQGARAAGRRKASSPPTNCLRPPTSSPTSVSASPANTKGESALTNEPVYQGEPVLAVAAVDELTAANAIEQIEIDWERLPFAVDPLVSLRPGGPNARLEGNVWGSRSRRRKASRRRRLRSKS